VDVIFVLDNEILISGLRNLISLDLELAESVALVESLPKWKVVGNFVDSK